MEKIKKLDEVLKFITYETTWKTLREHFPDNIIEKDEMKMILTKLRKDGYIEILQDNMILPAEKHYAYSSANNVKRTFEGDFFVESNGYVGEGVRRKAEKIRIDHIEVSQRSFRRTQNWLLLLVAVGTLVAACYYGLEIWKYFYPR